MQIRFDRGTLVCEAEHEHEDLTRLGGAVWDAARRAWCIAPGRYADLQRWLRHRGISITNQLPDPTIEIAWSPPALDEHESVLLDTWQSTGQFGALVLPHGAPQTRVALNAIARLRVTTLCLAPDPRVLEMWRSALAAATGHPIPALGEVASPMPPVSVSTYAEATLWLPWFGDRFGLVVVDDSHPARFSPELFDAMTAPARLGLVATLPGPLAGMERGMEREIEREFDLRQPATASDAPQRTLNAVWLREAIARAMTGVHARRAWATQATGVGGAAS